MGLMDRSKYVDEAPESLEQPDGRSETIVPVAMMTDARAELRIREGDHTTHRV